VTDFVKKMTNEPVFENDYYKIDLEKMKSYKNMKGDKFMNFGGLKTDSDRMKKQMRVNSFIDSTPLLEEWDAWNLRPREKDKEVGP
jgi:hypothetical protein